MALLEVNSLTAFYGDFQALYGVSLSVDEGQAVAVIGANGAGKSTLLKSVVGMIRAAPGMIRFNGDPIGGIRSPKIVARGVTMAPRAASAAKQSRPPISECSGAWNSPTSSSKAFCSAAFMRSLPPACRSSLASCAWST